MEYFNLVRHLVNYQEEENNRLIYSMVQQLGTIYCLGEKTGFNMLFL